MGLESHGVPVIYCWAGGEGRRKVFYPLLVLQVMKFDSEWGEEARQCYLEMDLWLIGQGFSLMDLYIKVFQMDVYFLLWLCCLLGWWDSFSFGLWNSETHNVVAESSRDENVAYHPNQRGWEGIPVATAMAGFFLLSLEGAELDWLMFALAGLRNFDVWCHSAALSSLC